MQRSPVMTRGNLDVSLPCLFQGQILGDCYCTFEDWVESLEPFKIELGQFQRRKLTRSNERR
jgi:hypothetical protein